MLRVLYSCLLLSLTQMASADLPDITAPPPPPALSDQEGIEPEVNIIQRDDETVEEYSINGQVYMIRVTPKKGPVYYLIDSDGDGTLDSSPTEIEPRLLIPSWVLFRW